MVKKIFDFVAKHKWAFMIGFAAAAAVCVVMGVDLGGECGAVMAMAVAAVPNTGGGNPATVGGGVTVTGGPLTTEETMAHSPELLEKDIYSKVVKVRPSNTPVDTITRNVKREKATSQIVEYYSVGVMPARTQLSTQIAAQTSANAVALVAKEKIFDVNDTILVPSVKGANGEYLVLYVTKKNDSDDCMVIATNTANGYVPAIAANADLVRIGFAGAEKDAQCAVMQALPTKDQNYCQVFEVQCEESEFQKFTGKEVEWNMTDIEENAVYEMKRKAEFSFLFGAMARFTDPQKKEAVYTTKGMWWQAESKFPYPADQEFTQETLTQLSQTVFTNNNGGKRRILFAGSDLIARLNNLPVDRVVNDGNEYVKLGIDFSTLVTKFGRIEVVHADVFDQMNMPGNGFVMDPENVVRKEFKPFTRRVLDLKSSGVRNTEAVFMQEVACINLLNPAAHCCIVAE